MSRTDPLNKEDLRALARRSRTGTLTSNEVAELEKATGQAGSFGKELKRIMAGNG